MSVEWAFLTARAVAVGLLIFEMVFLAVSRISWLVILICVRLLGHKTRLSFFGQLFLELLSDKGFFVRKLNLVPDSVLDLFGPPLELNWRMKSQVSGRTLSYVEVLVKPPVGWHDQAGLMPGKH